MRKMRHYVVHGKKILPFCFVEWHLNLLFSVVQRDFVGTTTIDPLPASHAAIVLTLPLPRQAASILLDRAYFENVVHGFRPGSVNGWNGDLSKLPPLPRMQSRAGKTRLWILLFFFVGAVVAAYYSNSHMVSTRSWYA
jgi:hypothetical protein